MSYTTPYIGIDGKECGKHNLKQATSDLMRAFFSQKYENTFYLPLSLRLGRKTFEAGKKLFIDKSLLFDDIWKTKYLLGDNLGNNYHYFWGLLTKIWPREKAKVNSDLFSRIRYKLRIIILNEIICKKLHNNYLIPYLLQYITNDWRRDTTELLLTTKHAFKNQRCFQYVVPTLHRAAVEIIPLIQNKLQILDENNSQGCNLFDLFSSVCGQLQFSAMWAPQETNNYLSVNNFDIPKQQTISNFLAHRTRLRAIHCLDNHLDTFKLRDASLKTHLTAIENKEYNDTYTLFSIIRNDKKLKYEWLNQTQKSEQLVKLWKQDLLKKIIYKYIYDMHQPWHSNIRDQSRYILIIISSLLSFRKFNIKSKEMAQIIMAIKNILRYFYRQQNKKRLNDNIYTIQSSREIISWIKRLEKFTNCRHW